MVDGLSLLTAVVSLGLQLQRAIEKIKGNKETHRALVHRINNSLQLLEKEYVKTKGKSHSSLLKSVQRLKSNLEYGLECCYKPAARATLSGFKSWFNKDSIELALNTIEKQISACFQEFTALGTLRIERKLGEHGVEVNRKLDELLKRTPARFGASTPPPSSPRHHHGARLQKAHKRASSAITSVARSDQSDTTVHSSVSIPKSYSTDRLHSIPHHNHPVVHISLPPPRQPSTSSTSTASTPNSSPIESQLSILSLQQQGDHLDSEYRRLRSLNFPSAAVTAARKAVAIRRIVCSMERSPANIGDLAKSLTYLGRSLRDLHVPVVRTGRPQEEVLTVLTECVRTYKEAFRADNTFRLDLAMALYNLSVRHVDVWTKKSATQSTGNLRGSGGVVVDMKTMNGDTSLAVALDTAGEAVHHFEILENGEPELYGTELANALLNLSFILTDMGRHERALGTARRAVSLCYQHLESLNVPAEGVSSGQLQNEERVKRAQILHKAMMRVSWCLGYLGKTEESAEAQVEADSVLKEQSTLLGV